MKALVAFAWFRKLGAAVCGVMLTVFTGLVLYSVMMRYLFSAPPRWGEELPKLLFVWMIFIGAAFAHFAGSNLRMTLLIDKVANGPRRVIELLMHTLILAMLLLILWYSVPIILLTMRSTSLATGLNDSLTFWALPVGACLLLINEVWRIARLIRGHVDHPVPLAETQLGTE
ncbi:TRAP transporter small permease [Puniceibacterium sp. IMCC21224]|uniref:TRAP transporter small permease n=1 Tax=Puniceibacterium sp. IMCC21224 TaxID=1618204 RepID=UPI00064DF7FD|nr:TRAP transporter small permease [Puniceibacterium sp. IMCC21224]KMK64919.1 TRAP-type C4-dicarboxylate transport system, small permease component [Puniceibacterium sp. IMCC21224]